MLSIYIITYIQAEYHLNSMAVQSKLSTFIEELRRRRVFRVAAVYAWVAFVVIQMINETLEGDV